MRTTILAVVGAAALLASAGGTASAQQREPSQGQRADRPSSEDAARTARAAEGAPAAATAGEASVMRKPVEVDGERRILVTNGPVPDTPENRKRFPPLSATGRATPPKGQ